MRIHELAKKYNVTNDELIQLLQSAGYDVSNHMSSVDYDMLTALERHFNWSAPKKKVKPKRTTKPAAEAEAVATKTKAKAPAKAKARPRHEAVAKEELAKSAEAVSRPRAKLVSKAKPKEVVEEKPAPVEKPEVAELPKKPELAEKPEKVEEPREAEEPVKVEEPGKTAATKAKVLVKPRPAVEPRELPTVKKAAPKPVLKVEPVKPKPVVPVVGKPVVVPEEKLPKTEKEKLRLDKKPPRAKRAAILIDEDEEVAVPRRRKPKAKKTAVEVEAQKKAVRESVRRTLAKLETTRKTKRRKPKADEPGLVDLPPVQVQDRSTVAMLADAIGLSLADVLRCCEELGVSAAPTQELDREVIELVCETIGRAVEIEAVYGEARLREAAQIDPRKLQPRAPVVTVMGHVDHGKTSILDYIRKTNVAAGEAGGITQHIGAYEVDTPQGKLTFVDTPGHEAFTAMRARGAHLTDIVVLVVGADDGVMPQTVEAINHTKAAGVAMVVAINKVDLPAANPLLVKQQLTKHGVVVEEYGGDVVSVEVSAKTGKGIDRLLELILLQAELLELKADPTAKAQGVVVEVKKEEGRGILCTVLVQQGTLHIGDVLVAGNEYGKVRSLLDHTGARVKHAGPSMPALVLGLDGLPEPGDAFICVAGEREAREISSKRQDALRAREMTPARALTLEDLYTQIQQGEVKELNIILKADANGSMEALRDSISPISLDEVKVVILHTGVGAVSEPDVLLASSSNALIIAFNTNVTPKARMLAKLQSVEIRGYQIIYEVIDDIDKALKGMLEPELVERVLGRAEVRRVFRVSKLGLVAGSMVTEGVIERSANARVFRGEEMVFDGKIISLKRFQDDVREVQVNFECGIGLSGFEDLQESDVIEAYVVEERARVV